MKRPFNFCLSKWVQAVLLSSLVVTVSACGQKGPLYLPEQPKAEAKDKQKKQEQQASTTERTKQNNKDKN